MQFDLENARDPYDEIQFPQIDSFEWNKTDV